MREFPDEAQQITVRQFARALARAGLATAFGHCSIRLNAETFLVCAARPMGTLRDEPGSVVHLDGALPPNVLGEVRMHREIYRLRSEVGAVARFVSPQLTALAALGLAPRPRHGCGAYFYPEVPMWTALELVRSDTVAAAVARLLGSAPAIIVSTNGAITAGATAAQALALACFLEDAARVELVCLGIGSLQNLSQPMSAEQAQSRATWQGNVAERVWACYTDGDPEQSHSPY
jgi:HCOMODA/2-hydroxy-3-carboxy-muconic semialdehyde decarboxylase